LLTGVTGVLVAFLWLSIAAEHAAWPRSPGVPVHAGDF